MSLFLGCDVVIFSNFVSRLEQPARVERRLFRHMNALGLALNWCRPYGERWRRFDHSTQTVERPIGVVSTLTPHLSVRDCLFYISDVSVTHLFRLHRADRAVVLVHLFEEASLKTMVGKLHRFPVKVVIEVLASQHEFVLRQVDLLGNGG